MKEAFSVAAGILAIAASVPYVIDIIKKRSKPNIVSWFTWTLLLAIGTTAAFAAHQPRTAFLTLGDLIGTGAVLLLGLRLGIAKLSWFDGFCQITAIAGLILWQVFNSPEVAIIAVIAVDLLGLAPTLRHSWEAPEEETWQTFFVLVFAAALTLFSLTHYSITSLSYPIYLLAANAAVAGVVVFRRQQRGLSLSRAGESESLHG